MTGVASSESGSATDARDQRGPQALVVEVATAAMATVFAIQLAGDDAPRLRERATAALDLVTLVESTCSRFRPESELSRLSATCDAPVVVSPLLFELLALAVAVAEASEGAFDPTVGRQISAMGFDADWATGVRRELPAPGLATWRDIALDRERLEVTLTAPLHLDLGAIAKGFAVDLVAQALADVPQLSVNAGGDVYCRGARAHGRGWEIGIRHPSQQDRLIAVASLARGAVCTSGSYERRTVGGAHHLIDPHRGTSARGLSSVSVAAPTAAIADALATAAFAMGADAGPAWITDQGADALFVTDDAAVIITSSSNLATWTTL